MRNSTPAGSTSCAAERAAAWLTALLLALAGGSAPAAAQKLWEWRDAGNVDLRVGGFRLAKEWQTGLLRLEIARPPGLDAGWSADLLYPTGETLRIDEALVRRDAVGDPDANPVRIDVPVAGVGRLALRGAPDGLAVRAVTVRHPARVNTQQRIKGSSVAFVVPGDDLDRQVGPGFGRLDAIGPAEALSCTAFRVATGYWLTAGHCAIRTGTTRALIQPRDYHRQPAVGGALSGRFVATGRSDGAWQPGQELAKGDPDYALLRVEDDPGGPAFPLASPSVKQGHELRLLMNWPNDEAGKASSAGLPCTVKQLVGTPQADRKPECYRAIQHGCTSDRAASGAVLVSRADPGHLVGLHYGGWNEHYNCALPAALILQDLCKKHPSLAGALTTCSNP